MLLRVLLMLVLVYSTLAGLLYLFQERLLFLPGIGGRELAARPDDRGLSYETVWLETDDGERLHAWWVPHPEPRAILLFSHGNAGNISHRLDSIRIFHELGLGVLIYDYRGYGRSSGQPSEAGVQQDIRAAWNWLTGEAGAKPERIVLFGRSMGGALAAQLASDVDAGGLILESTFTSVPDLAAELYWWLPARLLARIKLNALDALGRSDQPTLIVHSRDDEIVPFGHGQRLLEAAPEPSRLLEIEGSHNTGFMVSGARYRNGLDDFLREHF